VDLASVSSAAINIVTIIAFLLVLGGIIIIGTILYLKRKQQWQFNCVIWERDGFGNVTETYDRAGIFVDKKTQNKRLFMHKANVGLDPDNVPYIPGKKKTVYLLRTGLKNFRYVKPRINNDEYGFIIGEEDVNWAINAYDRQKRLFNQNALMQYLPFIALAFVSIIILVIFIYFFKDFAVLRDVAVALKEAAVAMAHAQSGTLVVP